MLAKPILMLLLFFLSVIIVSELRNLMNKYASGFNVEDLQIILHHRGISYEGAFEKKESINFIEKTGQTSQYKWKSAKSYKENESKFNFTTVSTISDEKPLKELAEDNRNSVWILMTNTSRSPFSFSDEYNSKLERVCCNVQSVYAQYGFNMAVLDCGNFYNLCGNRGFHRAPFVLMLPHNGVKLKEFEDFSAFVYSDDVVKESVKSVKKSVVDWIKIKMTHRFNQQPIVGMQINDPSGKPSSINFQRHFIRIYPNTSGLRRIPPTSILAHSVKFAGQINFWSGTLSDIPLSLFDKIYRELMDWKPHGHFFIGYDDLVYRYGTKPGQSISYDLLQLFFRDVFLDSNGIFLWSSLIIILILSFQISMGYGVFYILLYCAIVVLYYVVLMIVVEWEDDDLLHYFLFYWQKLAISSLFQRIHYLQLCNKFDWPLFIIVWLFNFVVLKHRTVLDNFNLLQQPHSDQSRLFIWTFQAPPILPSDVGIGALSARGNPGWPEGYILISNCSICCETFLEAESLCGLPCKHSYHKRCINKWLVKQPQNTCPLCRSPVYEERL